MTRSNALMHDFGRNGLRCLTAGLFLLTALSAPLANAQGMFEPPQNNIQPQPAQAYSQGQLDQMLAPIALYPDALVSQILMASTYPLEVVEAERWRENPQNGALRGDALAAALEQQPWDPSVKSLVPFPQVLQMMNQNLQWTEQLGDAFLAQQGAVMDSIQHLRQQAQAAGNLRSTPQQIVTTDDQEIIIAPANPQIVYVPYYNPAVVYGAWDYPQYPPYYFAPPPGYAYGGAVIGFGIGFAILSPFWGWDHWDWHDHHIDIDGGRYARINHDRPPVGGGVWAHDPAHRGGVPYRSQAARAQFQRTSDADRRTYRGYNNTPAAPHAQPAADHNAVGGNNINNNRGMMNENRNAVNNASRPTANNTAISNTRSFSQHSPTASMVRPAAAETHSAPMFESLPRGADAHVSAARGNSSRAAAAPHAETPRAAPASHGGGPAPHGGGHDEQRR